MLCKFHIKLGHRRRNSCFLCKFKRKCHHNGNSCVVCKFHRKLGHRRRNSCFCVSSKENAIIMETLVLSLSSIENWVIEEETHVFV
jgi:hypothetical protein